MFWPTGHTESTSPKMDQLTFATPGGESCMMPKYGAKYAAPLHVFPPFWPPLSIAAMVQLHSLQILNMAVWLYRRGSICKWGTKNRVFFIPFSACFIIHSLLSFFHHSFLLSFFHHSSLLSFFHNSFPTQLFSSFVPVQLFFIIHSLLSCFHYSLSAHSAFFIIHSLLSFFKIHSLLSFIHHSFPAQLFSSFILFLSFL